MSFQTFCGKDPNDPTTYQKVLKEFLDDEATAVPALNAVLGVGNSASNQSMTDIDDIGCVSIETSKVYAGNFAFVELGEAGDDIKLLGATAKGSIVAGNGVLTKELPVGTNGYVLTANSGAALGVEWAAGGGGSTPTLSAVLTAGNSAGTNNISMNNHYIDGLNGLYGTTTAGVDLSISSNNNIIMSADNIDLGTTEIIYPTLATPARLRLKASGSVVVDNNGGGTSTASSAVVLNQVSATGGILTEEVYNQRTATNGSFSQKSFYAKNSGGGKLECARISAVAENITSNRGQLDFAVAGSGGTISTYLSLSGNNNHINANRNIDMNNNNITSCDTIETTITNYYSKQITPVVLNAHTTISSNVEPFVRYNAFNAGRTATWDNSNIADFSSAGYGIENITASIWSYNGGAWVVGTEVGNIFYTYDTGTTWTFVGGLGGRINCMTMYNSNSNVAIGGQFSGGAYQYLCGLNSSWTLFDLTPSLGGLNGAVNCIFDDQSHFGLLQIGGAFTDFNGGSGSFYGFVVYNWNTSGFAPLNNYSGGGFTGGEVKSIVYDSGSGFIVVGGTFATEDIGSGSIGIPYLFTFQTPDGIIVSSYFSAGFIPNNPVNSVILYPSGSGLLVGGDFNNSAGIGSCNTNYGVRISWSGSSWDLNDYPIYNPSNNISSIFYNSYTGVYYTIENGNSIRSDAIQLPAIPVGSSWTCILYNGSNTLFATNAQSTAGFLLYALNNSLVIVVNSPTFPINTYSGVYTNINLQGFGSAVECMYISGAWWVVSQVGCSFS